MKNNRGLTLIEVLVSMVIVIIFFMGISAGGLLVLDQNIKNDQRDEAVSVAEEAMQDMRNTVYDNLVSLNNTYDNVSRRIRGGASIFSVYRTVSFPDNVSKELAQLGVDVSWIRTENGQQKTYTHSLRTIVRK